MGFEVVEEFPTIMSLPTVSTNRSNKELDKRKDDELLCLDDEEGCRTPRRSPEGMLRSSGPLLCPPAPRKARSSGSRKLRPPPQGFFEVPDDLASVFMVLPSPSKKIRTS